MSKSRRISGALIAATIALTIFLCLFGRSSALGTWNVLASVARELENIFCDSETQWMVFLCVAVYFLTFLLLQFRQTPRELRFLDIPTVWLTGVVAVGALAYAVGYSATPKSTQALTLLVAAALGQGVGVWSRGTVPGTGGSSLIPATLIIFLLTASLWQPDIGRIFEYRGHARWSGPWNNPNIFGLLMGTGIVLVAGGVISIFGFQVSTKLPGSRPSRIKKLATAVLCFGAVILMSHGLLRSYSRGAWAAAVCGLGYLAFQAFMRRCGPQVSGIAHWLRRTWLPISVIIMSAGILVFWQFRQTEWHPARRALSVGNRNDFSWRNRITAWEGTLQMMAEKPWFGFGWNQPEPMYEKFYLPPKMTESAAIQMNDWLLLGATLGLPALFGFGMYIWLCLAGSCFGDPPSGGPPPRPRNREDSGQTPGSHLTLLPADFLPAACRAGAVVLLVGFWFDGGLFKLPTASTFWILLELGRRDLTNSQTQ